MTVFSSMPCAVEGCEEESEAVVLVGRKAYGVCKKHFKLFKEIKQLALEDYD